MKKVFIPLILILSALPSGAQTVFSGQVHSFTLEPDYVIESFTTSKLVWQADSNETLQVSVTVSSLPDNISSVVVDAITFSLFLDDGSENGTQTAYSTIVPQDTINKVDDPRTYNQSIEAPVRGDNFFFIITIIGRTTGNVTQSTSQDYSYRFPVDNTILVSREGDLVPLINLYGFPPRSYFLSWLPIYVGILVVISIPSLTSAIDWGRQKMKKEEET